MGVSTNVYTYYGVKIDWNSDFVEEYDYDDNGVDILVDGMGGDYIIFGNRLFDSGDFRWDLEDSDDIKEIDIQTLPEIEAKYRAKFAKFFPKFVHLIESKPFKIISLVHYS